MDIELKMYESLKNKKSPDEFCEILDKTNELYKEAKTIEEKYKIYVDFCFAVGRPDFVITYKRFFEQEEMLNNDRETI